MSSLSGKLIAFSGTLELTRTEAKAQAEAAGAIVGSSVSGKTNILVAGKGAGAKVAAAKDKDIDVWTEAEFVSAIAAKGQAGGKKKKGAPPSSPEPAAKKAKTDASPSHKVASTVVSSTTDDSVATADPDAVLAMAGLGVTSDIAVTDHFKLVQIEIASNTDKFFIAQSLSGVPGQGKGRGKGKAKQAQNFVFTRWGRTGTKGQARLEGPLGEAEAAGLMASKFKEKTGNEMGGTFAKKAGKYDLVAGDTGQTVSTEGRGGGCLWQYWVGDGVDGKPDGWYDYTREAAAIVEGVHSEWVNNASLDVRCVQSGVYPYCIDFNTMVQTNVGHPARKQRLIRRNA